MARRTESRSMGTVLRAVVRDVPSAIVVTDVQGRVALANRAGRKLLGRPGRVSLIDGVLPEDRDRLESYLAAVASSVSHRSVHLADLAVRWGDVDRVVAVDARLLRGVPGFRGLVVSLQDVSQYVEELQSLRRAAYEDPLTGLANRAAMWNALQQAHRAGADSSLLFIDLDRFKAINDEHGHDVGDRVLSTVARRLGAIVGSRGLVSRFGGDEFVVLLHDGGPDEARRMMTAIALVIERSMALGLEDLVVSAGVGGASLRAPSVDVALRRADESLYRAKRAGRAQTWFWTDDDEEWRVRRADVEAELAVLRQRLDEARTESRTDFLTELPNTRKLFEDLDALGTDGPRTAGLVFIDLDHFGSVNHARGDTAGDDVLRRVGDVFRAACRDGDTVYRKGGEEFVVLLPGAGLEQAERVAQRFRRRLLEAQIPHRGRDDMPVVTLSAGVASARIESKDGVDSLMKSAAMRMLLAKQTGRDRVVTDDDRPET